MTINFSPLNISFGQGVKKQKVNPPLQALGAPSPLAFRGRYNDAAKFDSSASDFFEYSLEQASPDERPRKGQIIYKPGVIFNRNTTGFFRSDLNWIEFGDYLKDRFKYTIKVNTYDYACSNGLEAYTLSLLLQGKFPQSCGRFFPIKAKDVNPDEILACKEKQKETGIAVDNAYVWAKYGLSIDDETLKEYLSVEEDDIPENDVEYLSKKVTSPVEFSCANVIDDFENIDSFAPSIFLCRNMWPYVQPSEYESFCDKLYEKLATGSVVVIGAYEYKGQKGFKDSNTFPLCLIKSGFKPADCCYSDGKYPLVFEKN